MKRRSGVSLTGGEKDETAYCDGDRHRTDPGAAV